MEFQLTDEQIATLLEGYQAMNGDTDTKSIVSDLGIQDYVSVSGNEVTSKPVETQTSGSGATTQTAPTTTSSPTTTTTTNDFGIPEINYTGGGNDTGKVDIDLSKVGGGDTPSEPSKPSKPSEPTPGSGPKGSEPSEPTKPTTTTDPKPGTKEYAGLSDSEKQRIAQQIAAGNATKPGDKSPKATASTGNNSGAPTTSPGSYPKGAHSGGSGGTGGGSGSGSAESTGLDTEAIKRHISGPLKTDFSNLKKSCNEFAQNINELQSWFYGPTEADCTSTYKKIKEEYSSEATKGKGIVGSIRAAFDWVDYADQYISQWEKYQQSGYNW